MKKTTLIIIWILVIFVITISAAQAGGIVNKQSLSVEYLRTFSRNGATDAADIAYYNPAGVMKMANGAYINTGLLYTAKEYTNGFMGMSYESDTPSVAPAIYALYKQEKWAGYLGFNVPGGGGKVEYDDGNITTFALAQGILALTPFDTIEGMKLKADSYYYGPFIGCAYKINDAFSIAASLRYVDATITVDGNVRLSAGGYGATPLSVEYEETADGWGAMFGIHYTPFDDLNIGFRYETPTKLDFKTELKKDDTGGAAGLVDGAKRREDLPGLVGIGIFYKLIPECELGISGTLYLEKSADWEDDRLQDSGNSWEIATALTYTYSPKFSASLGYMITKTEIDADNMLPEAPELDVITYCGGFAYKPIENLTLNLALAKSIYDTETTSTGLMLDKMAPALAFGVEWKFK